MVREHQLVTSPLPGVAHELEARRSVRRRAAVVEQRSCSRIERRAACASGWVANDSECVCMHAIDKPSDARPVEACRFGQEAVDGLGLCVERSLPLLAAVIIVLVHALNLCEVRRVRLAAVSHAQI